jgi:hypothetical protein
MKGDARRPCVGGIAWLETVGNTPNLQFDGTN